MKRIKKGYVDIPQGQIHYHMVEGGDLPVIFLHQTALSANTYDPLLQTTSLPNRLIALDTPGFGNSYAPEGWPTLEEYAEQLLAAIDALGCERVHLFGHHTGATLAIEMAARQPERVASLMLAGPVFMTEMERQEFIEGYREPIHPQRDGSHLLANWGYAALYNPDCDLEILQTSVADMLRAWRARPQAYMAVAHHDTENRAKGLSMPVLLLTTPGDFFYAEFDRAKAVFPHAATAETGGDNFPTAADPEGVSAAIENFLSSL